MNSPFSNIPRSPSALRDQSIRELQQFYQKPIAKVSTELIITICTVIFLAIFAIQPTLNTMSSLLKNIDDKQKVDQDLTKKAAALSTANAALVPLENQVRILDQVIPNSPDLDGILRRIEKLASGRSIVLTTLQSSVVPKENDPDLKGTPELSVLTLQVGVSGTYANVKDFLEALLQIDRQLSVVSVSIAAKKDAATATPPPGADTAAASPDLQMSITIQAHYYGVPVETVPGTT